MSIIETEQNPIQVALYPVCSASSEQETVLVGKKHTYNL